MARLLPRHRRLHDRRQGAADRRAGARSWRPRLPRLRSRRRSRSGRSKTRTSGGRAPREHPRRRSRQRGVSGADVAAVGLTGQMHGLVLLDAERRVLRPAILWNDQRTGAQCDEIRERMGGRDAARPASPATTRSPASPRRRSSGCARTSPRSTRGRGSCCCPRTTSACGSPARPPWTRRTARARCCSTWPSADWSTEVLAALDIPRAWLPPTLEGPEVTGRSRRRPRPGDGPARGHAGHGGRRRSGRGRCRHRRDRARAS